MRENLSSVFGNNKGADHPVHPHSLIISELATSKFSVFKLVSVAEEIGSSLALSETPHRRQFSCIEAQINM